LIREGTPVLLTNWAREICMAMRPVCELLDNGPAAGYTEALEQQLRVIDSPELTPSARLLAELRDSKASFADYGLVTAKTYREYFRGLADEFNNHRSLLLREAAESVQRQKELEAADELSLDEFIARYYA
jgi:glutamate--cysteine ligase